MYWRADTVSGSMAAVVIMRDEPASSLETTFATMGARRKRGLPKRSGEAERRRRAGREHSFVPVGE
jgi:hypothetical protein